MVGADGLLQGVDLNNYVNVTIQWDTGNVIRLK